VKSFEKADKCFNENTVKLISKPASTGINKSGQFGGLTGFVRLPMQRNIQQGLEKLADIQGGPVLEKFHCIQYARNSILPLQLILSTFNHTLNM
jgi:hypothetical protein